MLYTFVRLQFYFTMHVFLHCYVAKTHPPHLLIVPSLASLPECAPGQDFHFYTIRRKAPYFKGKSKECGVRGMKMLFADPKTEGTTNCQDVTDDVKFDPVEGSPFCGFNFATATSVASVAKHTADNGNNVGSESLIMRSCIVGILRKERMGVHFLALSNFKYKNMLLINSSNSI